MEIITSRRELSPEEKKLPLAKYYDLPLYSLAPREQQIIDYSCPIDPKLAIKPENFLDLLQPTGHQKVECGYCMMPDGTGYVAIYLVYPNCTPQMLAWWLRWINIRSKGMPKDKGNLRYKIWMPADHWDHGFINGKDQWDGIYTVESRDLGQGEDPVYTIRHPFKPREYGLTEERERALKALGCFVDCSCVTYYSADPSHKPLPSGTHVSVTLSRQNPLGYMEKCTRFWFGWKVKDGKVVREETTPASVPNEDFMTEDFMKRVLIHAIIEGQQLSMFLPELYAHYKDLPDDAD